MLDQGCLELVSFPLALVFLCHGKFLLVYLFLLSTSYVRSGLVDPTEYDYAFFHALVFDIKFSNN